MNLIGRPKNRLYFYFIKGNQTLRNKHKKSDKLGYFIGNHGFKNNDNYSLRDQKFKN